MMKIGQIVFVISLWVWASSLGYANAEFTPLLDTKDSETINLDARISSAKSAIDAGLYSMAESVVKKVLETDTQNKEAKYVLIDALLGQAKFNSAKKILADFDGDTDEAIYLKRAIVSVALADYARASFFLNKIRPRKLSGDDLSWYYLTNAFVEKSNKNFKSAQDYFDLVSENTDNRILKNLSKVYNYQSMIERSFLNPDTTKATIEKLLPDLEKSYLDYNGTEIGFVFAKDYALALHALGETSRAIEILSVQLDSPIISESNFEELAISLILISRKAAIQRNIFTSIFTRATSLEVAETALYLLDDTNKDKALTISNLEEIIYKRNCAFKDRLLLECAYLSLALGKNEDALEYANALLKDYPASRYLTNATGVLAHNAFSAKGKEAEYRLAAKHLETMANLEKTPEKSAIMKLLSADCYYLDKNYELSAIAYKDLYQNLYLDEYKGIILNRYLDSLLKINDVAGASELVDKAFRSNIDRNQLWAAQWNMISYLRKAGELKRALNLVSRALNILEGDKNVNEVLLLRIMWLKAKLCIENQEFEECILLSNRILNGTNSLNEEDRDLQILINSDAMLLKARSQAQSDSTALGDENSRHTFEILRQIYPKTEAAIASYLIEAGISGTHGDLLKASKFCEELYENYPNSQYAPIALFEAAQYLKSTGQNTSYRQALQLLATLIKDYPRSDLIFYAKVSQAEMLRSLNAFSEASNIYQDIINNFPNHKDINVAHIGLGDSLLARDGSEYKAAVQYDRAYNLAAADMDSKAEAGYKLGFALQKSNRINDAQQAWFLSANELLSDKLKLYASPKARYWLGRTLLYLARSYESTNDKSSAIIIYNMIIDNNLPSEDEAKQRLKR